MRWRDNHLIHKSNCLTYLTLGKAGVPCNSDYEKIKKNSHIVLTGWGDVTVSSFTHCRFVDFIELRFKIRFPGLPVWEDRKPLRSTFDVSIYSIGVGMGDTSLHHSGTHAKFIVKSFKVRQQLPCVSIAVRCQVVESAWHHSYNIFSRILFSFATCRAWCIAVRHRAIELDWMPPVFMMWLLISVFHLSSKNLFSWKCFAGKRGIACMALNGSTGTKFFYVFNGYYHNFTTHVGKRGCISLHRIETRCRHKTHYSLINSERYEKTIKWHGETTQSSRLQVSRSRWGDLMAHQSRLLDLNPSNAMHWPQCQAANLLHTVCDTIADSYIRNTTPLQSSSRLLYRLHGSIWDCVAVGTRQQDWP